MTHPSLGNPAAGTSPSAPLKPLYSAPKPRNIRQFGLDALFGGQRSVGGVSARRCRGHRIDGGPMGAVGGVQGVRLDLQFFILAAQGGGQTLVGGLCVVPGGQLVVFLGAAVWVGRMRIDRLGKRQTNTFQSIGPFPTTTISPLTPGARPC